MSFQELLPIWVIVCPLVFFGGVLDAVAGGGGLITVSAYLLAGLPPHVAVATNKCGNLPGTLLSATRFVRAGHYHIASAAAAAVAALVGAFAGARLILIVPEQYLHYLLIALIPLLAAFLFLKRDFGTESRVDTLSTRRLLALSGIIGLLLGAYDGFFGPGAGTFLIMGFAALCRFDLLTASGNAKLVNCCSSIVTFLTFAAADKIWWSVGIPAAFCGVAGAQLGANIALKGGAKVIRPMFLVVMALLLLRLVWDLLG